MRKLIVPALAALLSTTTVVPASAQAPSTTVSYTDLDLSTSAGVDELKGRIRGAVRRVCGTPEPGNLHAMRLHRECVADARELVATEMARVFGDERALAMATMLRDATRG